MTIKEQIEFDFKEAYLNRDMVKKNFLALLKGQMQTQEGKLIPSTDENVLKMLKTFEKSLNEMVEAKKKLNQDVAETENELSILKKYLPTSMSNEEILKLVTELLSSETNKNVGFLMGKFNKLNVGKAFDNKTVMQILQTEINK